MSFRSTANHVAPLLALFATVSLACYGQRKTVPSVPTNSASHVAAEMTSGKLNPADSKVGDAVEITLKEDVRSNGEIILKKDATITGVIRNVKQAVTKNEWKGQAQSMIEIEWLMPPIHARGVQSLSFALDSVTPINSGYEQRNSNASLVARPVRNSGALLETATNGTAGPSASIAVSGRPNAALLSMPSVIGVDQQTSAGIESALGRSASGQLFRVGHSQFVDLYSHLSNDTVITSPGSTFEISRGAQMEMLVGVNRK